MRRVSLLLLSVLACLTPGPVFASACSNPNGNEADEIYNYAYHTKQFCNGSTWIAEGAAGGSGGPMLISTQTASSSASLQFTNLPTTYNTLFLNCAGLVMSGTTNWPNAYVGEGAGPTWETGSNYTMAITRDASSGSGTLESYEWGTTNPNLWPQDESNSSPYSTSVQMYINNVGSSSIYKITNYTMEMGYSGNTSSAAVFTGMAYWNADTNPITGLEVVASGGTILSGTCSLYGMN